MRRLYLFLITITAENVVIPEGHAKVGEPFVITLTAKNTGTKAFHNVIGLMDKDKTSGDYLAGGTFDIEVGQQKDITITYVPTNTGEKHLMLKAAPNITLKDNINIVADASDKTSLLDLTLSQQMVNAEGSEVIDSVALVDVTVTNNNDKCYKGYVYLGTWKWDAAGNGSDEYTTQAVEVGAHEKKVVRLISKTLTGGVKYSFTTGYYQGEYPIHELSQKGIYYTTVPYYTIYDADGNATNFKSKDAVIKLTARQCAIDLRTATDVKSVSIDANPNALIFMNGDASSTGSISGFTTMTLPFAATGCQIQKGSLTWATANTDGNLWVMEFTQENGQMMAFNYPGTTLEAYRPYLLGVPGKSYGESSLEGEAITFYAQNAILPASGKAVTTAGQYKMVGTLEGIADKADIYVLNAEGTAFVRGTASVSPFRAYFAPTSAIAQDAQLNIALGNSTTGIVNVNLNGNGDGNWYDLQGRRVNSSNLHPSPFTVKKGIYIVNGKKIIR